jgi:hypothetical protein
MSVRARIDAATHLLVQLMTGALSKTFNAPATIRNGGCKNTDKTLWCPKRNCPDHTLGWGGGGAAARRPDEVLTPLHPSHAPSSSMAGAHVPFSQQTYSSDQQNTQIHFSRVRCPSCCIKLQPSPENPAALQRTGWHCSCVLVGAGPIEPLICRGFNHVQYGILGCKAV